MSFPYSTVAKSARVVTLDVVKLSDRTRMPLLEDDSQIISSVILLSFTDTLYPSGLTTLLSPSIIDNSSSELLVKLY